MCLFEQTSNNSATKASISIITRCNGKFYSISTCMQPAATVFLLCKPGIYARDIEMRSRQARREKTENRKLFHAPIDWLLPPLLFPFIFLSSKCYLAATLTQFLPPPEYFQNFPAKFTLLVDLFPSSTFYLCPGSMFAMEKCMKKKKLKTTKK